MSKTADTIAPSNVTKLYSIASITPIIGVHDYTEGIYNGDPATDYRVAQKNQHNYLLDEIEATAGFRLLDIGCGLGTLLETARERGVAGTGITISEEQARICRAKGLAVELLNYRNLPPSWKHRFDGIIANGSIEHFCQPQDALNGKQNSIYQEMFQIFCHLLNPDSPSQKIATTTIHFRDGHIDPRKFLKHPLLQLFDDTGLHTSIIYRGYGGYYPIDGQLAKAAQGVFTMEKEVDGTQDYHLTSEYWCKTGKEAFFHNPQFQKELAKYFSKHPLHTTWIIASFIHFEAWPWQFRGTPPPTKLYRHTWKKT